MRTHLAFKTSICFLFCVFIIVPKPHDVRGRCRFTRPNIFCGEQVVILHLIYIIQEGRRAPRSR